MGNELHLGHELLLLHLDDASGQGRLGSVELALGYGGAIVAQWLFDERLVAVRAGQFVLRRRGDHVWPSLEAAEACMPDQPRSLEELLRALYGWMPDNRLGPAIAELAAAGCIEQVTDRFLGIPWRTRWPEADGGVEAGLIRRLRAHVRTADATTVPCRDDALLGVLRATELLQAVWSADELATVKPAIDARTERAPIGRDVHRAIAQTHSAIVTAATNVAITP